MRSWAEYEPMVELALERGGHDDPAARRVTVSWLRDQIAARKAQLWPGETSVGITGCVEFDGRLALHIYACAGELAELLRMLEAVEELALNAGIPAVTFSGRLGWSRVLAPHGFVRDNELGVYIKEVRYGRQS